eukprot:TRINITY_DN21111_c0_g1_i1.p1 TRINITY_DN21111_c0_g1~~TRINITY_DN21111_c0_g1_i1.p1  ORF type:complete len:652 (-),score=133.80 TRINITY_DN21111_c0_g1_i1:4-1959(-)
METFIRYAGSNPPAAAAASTVTGLHARPLHGFQPNKMSQMWNSSALGGLCLLAGSLGRKRRVLRGADKLWVRSSTKLRAAAGSARAEKVPVVLLSGFLGTGKTTLLRHWLENAEGRIGIVVNDVAAVNIDSKLVRQQNYDSDGQINSIQLQDGCACCTLGEELLLSVWELLELAEGGEPFSQIVVELSGVAEPAQVQSLFEEAAESGNPLMDRMELSKIVTVLDTSTFCENYMDYAMMQDREDLKEGDNHNMGELQVVELLVEQTEAAHVVILNKTDLAAPEHLDTTKVVVSSLNSKANVMQTSFGKIPLSSVLREVEAEEPSNGHESGSGNSQCRAKSCNSSDTDDSSEPTCKRESQCQSDQGNAGSCGGSKRNDESQSSSSCGGSKCKEESPSSSNCGGSKCAEENPSSSSCGGSKCAEENPSSSSCGGSKCTEESPSSSSCGDPTCEDESCNHSHDKVGSLTTAQERFGISSFTYTARRPFSEERFVEALKKWPVPQQDDLGMLLSGSGDADEDHPMAKVIRSKGFCWMQTRPSVRMYWAHAGKSMQLKSEGLWWGAMSKDQINLFEGMAFAEYERSLREDWVDDFADRRQEIVFIGQNLDEPAIRAILDESLLTDDEMVAYKERQDEDMKLLSDEWNERIESLRNQP